MKKTILFSLLMVYMLLSTKVFAQDQIIGEVRPFAGKVIPNGWMSCEGQLLAISQNQALYTVLSTTYGGDGKITFALPDLRDRVIVGASTPSAIKLGEKKDIKTGSTGASTPHKLGVAYIIAVSGSYPSRN